MKFDSEKIADRVVNWYQETKSKKAVFIRKGIGKWEFTALMLTIVLFILALVLFPGLYLPQDTIPEPNSYETIIIDDISNNDAIYVDIDCRADDIVSSEEVAYRCEYRFEQSNGDLKMFDGEYVHGAIDEILFYTNWTRTTPELSEITRVVVRPFTDESFHQIDGDQYTIHGAFTIIAPRTPAVYSFSISMGSTFGGEKGDVESVTVFSPSEASTIRTRDALLPFQRLVFVGVVLSLVKFWIDLIDRINSKINH